MNKTNIADLWAAVHTDEEKIAAKFASRLISADELRANAGIVLAMANAIEKIKARKGVFDNPKGYVFTAGINAAKGYIEKRRLEKKATLDIDGAVKNEHGDYVGIDISDFGSDPEKIAIAKITVAEAQANSEAATPKITNKKPNLTNNIRQALNMGLDTKREVMDYLTSCGVAYSSAHTVSMIMYKIRKERGIQSKHKKALAKARALFADDNNIGLIDFMDKMVGVCKPATARKYYSLVREKPCSANRA